MKFRNYCLVVIGNTEGVEDEIKKISESGPNSIKGGGLVVATFSSAAEPKELNDWFRLNKRSFFLFDLNAETSGFHIIKPDIHEGLFGFLKTVNLDDKTEELLREINLTSDTKNPKTYARPQRYRNIVEKKITQEDIDKMSKYEKEALWNKIVDNGVEKMSEDDKKLLNFLSK
jgi:hypothetical protein